MIDFKEIQLKLNNILLELRDIFSRIDEELDNQDDNFLQAKEIEKTIQKLEKNGVAVPNGLIKLKTDLISKTAYFEGLSKLKIDVQNKVRQIADIESMPKKDRKHTRNKTKKAVIYSFAFLGKDYDVFSWRDFFITFVRILGRKHPDFATKAVKIKGRKRPYFTKDRNLLRTPVFIDEISLYVETHFSSNGILKIVYKLLNVFGYKKQDLQVKANDI